MLYFKNNDRILKIPLVVVHRIAQDNASFLNMLLYAQVVIF